MQAYTNELKKYGVKPSYTRLMIFGYLKEKMNHPTVDEIYQALSESMPTLSKTTVYNTLHIFAEKNIARMISINNAETRYDLVAHPHAHFKCMICGEMYDVDVEPPHITKDQLSGYEVEEAQLLYTGKCPKCKQTV